MWARMGNTRRRESIEMRMMCGSMQMDGSLCNGSRRSDELDALFEEKCGKLGIVDDRQSASDESAAIAYGVRTGLLVFPVRREEPEDRVLRRHYHAEMKKRLAVRLKEIRKGHGMTRPQAQDALGLCRWRFVEGEDARCSYELMLDLKRRWEKWERENGERKREEG